MLNLLTEEDIPARHRTAAERKRTRVSIPQQDLNTQRGDRILGSTYDAVCEELSRSVVLLEVWRGGQRNGEGTGTIVTEDGLILTCEHVIRNADRVRARVYCPGAVGGDTRWFEAELLEPICKDCDMALLKLDGTNFTPAALRGHREPVQTGEETLMLGFPLGGMLSQGDRDALRVSNFAGRVASCQQSGPVERCYIDSTGLHGNSGSPVFSCQDRRVLGVFSGSIIPRGDRTLDELNYFHPIRFFWERFTAPEGGAGNQRGGEER